MRNLPVSTSPFRNAVRAAQAQVKDIEARLAQFDRDVKRTRRLRARNSAPEEALEKLESGRDRTRASLDAARAQLQEASRQLRDTRLVAPFAGTVAEVRLDPGEVAQPGTPVVVLSAHKRFEVAVEVPEYVRAGLIANDRVVVEFPLAGLPPTEGSIDRVSNAAAGPGQLFTTVVTLRPTPRLAAGYTAEVALRIRQDGGLMVPISSVADPGGQSPFVFRVRSNHAEKVRVRIGNLIEDHVTVQSYLRLDDLIVIQGHGSLLDRETVELIP